METGFDQRVESELYRSRGVFELFLKRPGTTMGLHYHACPWALPRHRTLRERKAQRDWQADNTGKVSN